MFKKLILIVQFAFTICIPSNAQFGPLTKFRHITVDDGLTQSSVPFMLRDKAGFMWIATGDGLSRYDGSSFEVFRNILDDSTTIASDNVHTMAQTPDGNIWMGFRKEGISVLNYKTKKFTHHKANDKNKNSLCSNDIRTIVADKKGNLWIGTADGLNFYNAITKTFETIKFENPSKEFPYPDENNIWALFLDKENLWIGCYRGAGLRCLNTRTRKIKIFKHDSQNTNSLIDNYVVNITKDKSGLMWIATRNGLSCFNETKNTFINYQNDPSNNETISSNDLWSQVFVDSRNNVWVGSYSQGLNIFNRKTNSFTKLKYNPNYNSSLSNNAVKSILEDGSGLIWIGTDNGINIYNPFFESFKTYQNIAGNNNTIAGLHVICLEKDNENNLWVGLGEDGVNCINLTKNTVEHFNNESNSSSIPLNNIRDITTDSDGNMVMTLFGIPAITRYDKLTKKFNPLGGFWGKSILNDKNGRIWVGTSTGFGPLDSIDNYHANPKNQAGYIITSLVFLENEDENHIWIGGDKTLCLFNTKTRTFVNYTFPYNVFSVLHDSKGRYWAGTEKGLCKFDLITKHVAKLYGRSFGFKNDLVSSIREDKTGNLWMGTNIGMICFNPETEKFMTYDDSDGLPNNEFNLGSVEINGAFYFGTMNGVLCFDPLKIKKNTSPPKIVFTSVSVLNKPFVVPALELGKASLNLNYDQYFFTINFAALDFTQPEKNEYAYQLIGFNDSLIYIGNKHEVTFTNLDPGSYKLKVIASNNHGIWNKKGIIINIIINPPWWKTIAFKISLISLIILLLIAIYNWRTASLKRRQKLLEQTVIQRTAEVVQQKEIIEEKQNEIIDSIKYASRIQQALLPSSNFIKNELNKLNKGSKDNSNR